MDSLNDASSVDLRVMVSQDSVERVAIRPWSEQDNATNSIIRGLEDGPFGKDGTDPSNNNVNVASNSNIHCVEDAPSAKDVNEYNHDDVNTLERSGGT